MSCTIEDLKKILEELIPADLIGLSGISHRIPRDQDTKIDAGPFGNVTRLELRSELRQYIDEAFKYSNFLFVLLRGPLSLNKDYSTSFADACMEYKFDIRSNNSSYLNPAFYRTYNENLVIEDAFDPNTGIQTMPKYQNAYKLCIELFSTKQSPRGIGLELMEETRHDLEFAAAVYSATYRLGRGGRKKTTKKPKHKKKKTLKKRR
jgi:hypothetical protein